MAKAKVVKWKISRLKKHPKQDEMFGDISEEERRALADDMERNGQRQPVEIRPDGTIIAGHQRVLAATLLGWAEIDVVVRYDLEEKGDAAVEKEFIDDNLIRRQLSPLARARCIRRLMEIEAGGRTGGLGWKGKEELKATMGRRLHVSPRSVSRYLLVLDAPPAVQRAFDQNQITLINAGKVALLGKSEQLEISKRIQAGEKAAKVITEYLSKPESRHKKVADAVAGFVRNLERGRQDLDGRVDEVRPGHVRSVTEELRKAHALIGKLIGKAAK